MKKKLLLMLSLVFVVACLFAISASAEVVISENNLDESGDIVADVLVDLGNNYHISSVDITYTATDGSTKNGKMYYETSLWTQTNKRQMKTVYVPADYDLSQLIYFCDKLDLNGDGEFAYNEYIRLYQGGAGYQTYSYVTYEDGIFTGTQNIRASVQAVSYSKYFEVFADQGFGTNAPSLKTVTYNGKEAVEGTFIISSRIYEIFGNSFGGNGSSLTANSTYQAISRLVFEDREGSITFGQYCFTRAVYEEIVFGKGTYKLNGKDRIALLFGEKYPDNATLKRVIVDKDTVISSGSISWNVGEYEVIFLGTQAELDSAYAANCQSALSCATSVIANPCYFGHTEARDDNDCTTAVVCPVCTTYIYKEAKEHVLGTGVSYEDYFKSGCYYEGCTNEGCLVREETELEALVEWKGYSVSTFGDTISVVQGFEINKEAINYYEAFNDGFELGAIAFGNTTGANVTPDFDNEKVLSSKLSLVNDYVDVCVKGVTEKIGDNRMALCLYIVDNTGVHFLNEGKTENSVLGISYAEILALNN